MYGLWELSRTFCLLACVAPCTCLQSYLTSLLGYTPFDRDTQRQEMEAIIAGDYRFEPGNF